MMNLEEFVSGALVQIFGAVKKAKKELQEMPGKSEGRINPGTAANKSGQVLRLDETQLIQDVEFDVAVTASSKEGTTGGAGIFVAALGLGVKGEDEQSSKTISRIRFKVPLIFP